LLDHVRIPYLIHIFRAPRDRPTVEPFAALLPPGRAAPIVASRPVDTLATRMRMDKVTLSEKFAALKDQWTPRIVGELNGQHVKITKVQGEFIWHHHDNEDEMFLVHRGRLRLEFRDRVVELGPGEFIVVPRGVEHRPVADEEVEVVLFEPVGTLNTGNVVNERTVAEPDRG
jgi:mannose-6-phosphate isomerase-like protein (cupin superfamily)